MLSLVEMTRTMVLEFLCFCEVAHTFSLFGSVWLSALACSPCGKLIVRQPTSQPCPTNPRSRIATTHESAGEAKPVYSRGKGGGAGQGGPLRLPLAAERGRVGSFGPCD